MRNNIELTSDLIDSYFKVDGLSLQNLFFTGNGKFPSVFMFSVSQNSDVDYRFDTEKLLSYLEDEYKESLQVVTYKYYNITTKKTELSFSAYIKSINIYLRFEPSPASSYLLYSEGNTFFDNLLQKICEFYVAPETEYNNLFLVAQDNYGFHLNKWKIQEVKNFDLTKNYNDDFIKADEEVRSFIEAEKTAGLVILHGEKGTGKTTYIRNLVHMYPKKKFIYVPSNLISMLSQPAFGNFIMTLENSVIILEDCESAIRDRKSTIGGGEVSLLLNMTDGLMGDSLAIKFICTFNANISDIDSALLRKGRCACKYEFKPLTPEKTAALLAEVKNVEYIGKGLPLSDIYNFDSRSFENERQKIGF